MAKRYRRPLAGSRVAVDDGSLGRARAQLDQQLLRAPHRAHRRGDVGAPLEPVRRLRRQPQAPSRPADRNRVEPGALERHAPRAARHFRVCAAHDSGHGLRARGVGNHQHVVRQRACGAVQRGDGFAGASAADPQLAAAEEVEVEGVHGMARLDHDVIGDVHEVVDRTDVRRLETRRHPGGGGSDGDACERRRVARAQVERVRLDRDRQGVAGTARRAGAVRNVVVRQGRERQRFAVDGRDLARNADDAETVGTVGGYLEVQHRVRLAGRPAWNAGRGIDRPHLEPVPGERVRQFLDRDRDRHELAQPRDQDLHSANCSSRRRSLS